MISTTTTYGAGSGLWKLWYFVHVALLLPLFWFADYFLHYEPGAGPQGGEAVFLLILLHMLAFGVVSVINILLLAFRTNDPLVPRAVLWPLFLFGAWIVGCALVLNGSDVGTSEETEAQDRWLGAVWAGAGLLLYYVANFAALRRIRRG
ncbi:MAG: hypothetical protein JNK67_11175 [Alphaproteobacteria bacterium]|nr:hypothetical protein [Alphaproteobacteria bacterium]